MRTATQAVNAAAHQGWNVPNLCLRYVRTWWGIGPKYASARLAWRGAARKHPGDRTPPKGAPVFFQGGLFGHVAIAAPTPGHPHRIISTDRPNRGRTSATTIQDLERAWGYKYLGWTGDLNGRTLPLAHDPK